MFGLFSAKTVILPTKARVRAAWLLLPIGTLMMLVGACLPSVIGLLGMFIKGPETAATQPTAGSAQAASLTMLAIVVFIGLETLGVTLLMARRKILQGGHASAIVALVLAGILAAAITTLIIVDLSNLIYKTKEIPPGAASLSLLGVILGLVWNFAIVLSLGLLIYFLLQVARERKPAPPTTVPPLPPSRPSPSSFSSTPSSPTAPPPPPAPPTPPAPPKRMM